MTATLIDGKAIAASLRHTLQEQVQAMDVTPGLAVILVGNDAASEIYVSRKIKACAKVGIQNVERRLPADVSQEKLLQVIEELNADQNVHGILLQLPLPAHLDPNLAVQAINPDKDVDGLHPVNVGRLVAGLDGFVPCTPQGSLMLIQSVKPKLSGLHAVVVGRSLLFGKPMGQLLLQANCTVTQAHSQTIDLPSHTEKADILVVAVGQAEFVKDHWVKEDAIVIDVGISRMESGDIRGDVDFESVSQKAKAITPVPGGVGPMTIACLLKNTVQAAQKYAVN